MRYLLIGNPNVGKSSVFNIISESYAHVANYGGITVEKKLGKFRHGELIDLPGTYSVSPTSEDEGIVTHSILNESYDGVVNIVDSTHLKRNLHLTIQLLELGNPLVIALNMIDELEKSGRKIDIVKLTEKLKCRVIGLSAKTKAGVDELVNALKKPEENKPFKLFYGSIIENAIENISSLIKKQSNEKLIRWLAIQLLEGNSGILSQIVVSDSAKVEKIIQECENEIINKRIAFSLKGAIFNTRRDFIDKLYRECLIVLSGENRPKMLNHRLDKWITHPFYGLIIFLLVMFGIYFFTFDLLGTILSDLIGSFIDGYFTDFVIGIFERFGVDEENLFRSLIIDGVIRGLGGVIVFVPQIAILFLMLAIIEGTGYMARVAIMLDTLLSKFGLNGKSIVPLVTGIGCNVPAIMATRTIANKKERLLTILIIPFMSCSARIPIYSLLATLFFDKYKALIILSMYVIGTVVALVSAKLLSLSIFKNTESNFILEIPPYRIPSGRNVYRHTKLMIKDFIEKAGKFILLGTIVIWFLLNVGPGGISHTQDDSFLAYFGNFFAPLFRPVGFGKWEATSSLIIGFLAKELILSSMIEIYGSEALVSTGFTGLSAYSFMVFSLLYLPCLATVGTIYQETKSLRFTVYSLLFTFSVAYTVSFLIYQIGILIM